MDTICLNGEFVSLERAQVAATDAGILLGDGVFETIRVERGQPLNYADHFSRLARGLRVLEIPYNVATEELLALCQQTIDANGHDEARLRITITRGPLRNLPIATSEGEPTVIITATARDDHYEDVRNSGWRSVVVPYPKNHRSALATVKCTSYMDSVIARRYASRLGFDEALLLNTDGLVAEASMANIFAVRGNRIITPPVKDGALPGIMRGKVLELARQTGRICEETSLTLEDIVAADELFFTNAMIQIMPVIQVGERIIGDGRVGPMTLLLFHEWRVMVNRYLSSI